MATYFAQVLFLRSFYVCFSSGHYFTPRLYFCQRWPAIHMCSALKYRSHRLPNFMFRQRSSQIGVVLSRDRLVVPLSTRPSLILISNLIIDASSISTLIKFFSLVKSVNNVSRSVAWSGITIDWARPTTSSSTRRIIIIESRSSSTRCRKGWQASSFRFGATLHLAQAHQLHRSQSYDSIELISIVVPMTRSSFFISIAVPMTRSSLHQYRGPIMTRSS